MHGSHFRNLKQNRKEIERYAYAEFTCHLLFLEVLQNIAKPCKSSRYPEQAKRFQRFTSMKSIAIVIKVLNHRGCMDDVLRALGCGKAFAFRLVSCPFDSTVETLETTTERTFCEV